MTHNPSITVSTLDAYRLGRLLDSLSGNAFPGRQELESELERASLVAPQDMPTSVVTMNSTVRFRVSSSEECFELKLVYPKDVEPEGTISILAPVGSALLGLNEGDVIEWPRPGGGVMEVTIEEVLYQPERAGEHHR